MTRCYLLHFFILTRPRLFTAVYCGLLRLLHHTREHFTRHVGDPHTSGRDILLNCNSTQCTCLYTTPVHLWGPRWLYRAAWSQLSEIKRSDRQTFSYQWAHQKIMATAKDWRDFRKCLGQKVNVWIQVLSTMSYLEQEFLVQMRKHWSQLSLFQLQLRLMWWSSGDIHVGTESKNSLTTRTVVRQVSYTKDYAERQYCLFLGIIPVGYTVFLYYRFFESIV